MSNTGAGRGGFRDVGAGQARYIVPVCRLMAYLSLESRGRMHRTVLLSSALMIAVGLPAGGQQTAPPPAATPAPNQAPPPASATNLGADPNGNPLRRALKDRARVELRRSPRLAPSSRCPTRWCSRTASRSRDRDVGLRSAAQDSMKIYETEIYGRIPDKTPANPLARGPRLTRARA